MSSRKLVANGLNMHIEESGEGPLVLWFTAFRRRPTHGDTSLRRWQPQAFTLSHLICGAMERRKGQLI